MVFLLVNATEDPLGDFMGVLSDTMGELADESVTDPLEDSMVLLLVDTCNVDTIDE